MQNKAMNIIIEGLDKVELNKPNVTTTNRLDEDRWVTVHGTHIQIDTDGNVTKGPENLRNKSAQKYGIDVNDPAEDRVNKYVEDMKKKYMSEKPAEVDRDDVDLLSTLKEKGKKFGKGLLEAIGKLIEVLTGN